MLNPELQQDIDTEIDRANIELRTFIRSKYFSDTLELIYRLHNIKEAETQEAIELETILYLLNISEYDNIAEAIKNEVYNDDVKFSSDIESVIKDIIVYIIDKSNEDSNIENIYPRKSDTYPDTTIHQEINNHLQEKEEKEEIFNPYTNRKDILPENYKERVEKEEENKQVDDITHITDKYREKIDPNDI